jgi:hypothetical protein
MTTPPPHCLLKTQVDSISERLAAATDAAGIQRILDDVRDEMMQSPIADREKFAKRLNDQLELTGALPKVLELTAQVEFDKINDGHSRVKDKEIIAKKKELHGEGRDLEEQLMEDLLTKEAFMKRERHEGVFLGLGNRDGIDLARLKADVDKSGDRIDAEKVLRQFGTGDQWMTITQQKGYLTMEDINQRLIDNEADAQRHPLTKDQRDALEYLSENFRQASREVAVCNEGCSENPKYERQISLTSLEMFVGKKFVGTGFEYTDHQLNLQRAGTSAYIDHDRRFEEYTRTAVGDTTVCPPGS